MPDSFDSAKLNMCSKTKEPASPRSGGVSIAGIPKPPPCPRPRPPPRCFSRRCDCHRGDGIRHLASALPSQAARFIRELHLHRLVK